MKRRFGQPEHAKKGFAISRDLRINQMIRVFELRVVDEDGSQLGVMRTADALRLAQERGLDLVEVAPLASPPVARLLDFGQYKYELTKREKEAKRRQRSITFKEVRLKPKIGIGDFDTKVRRAIEFLEEGDRVKISVQFRGRELTHPGIGRDLLDKFAEKIKEHGVVERPPLLEGKSMHISVASTHKPKPVEPNASAKSHGRDSDDEPDDMDEDEDEIDDAAEETTAEAAPVVQTVATEPVVAEPETVGTTETVATETVAEKPAVKKPAVRKAPVKKQPAPEQDVTNEATPA